MLVVSAIIILIIIIILTFTCAGFVVIIIVIILSITGSYYHNCLITVGYLWSVGVIVIYTIASTLLELFHNSKVIIFTVNYYVIGSIHRYNAYDSSYVLPR